MRSHQIKFPVSAILKSDTVSISGVNVEVSDWTKGLCRTSSNL